MNKKIFALLRDKKKKKLKFSQQLRKYFLIIGINSEI